LEGIRFLNNFVPPCSGEIFRFARVFLQEEVIFHAKGLQQFLSAEISKIPHTVKRSSIVKIQIISTARSKEIFSLTGIIVDLPDFEAPFRASSG
jgi:hypothetical protein